MWQTKKSDNFLKLEKNVRSSGFYNYMKIIPTSHHLDKSLFIKEIFNNENKKVLITAPTNFGKSTNLGILRTFLEIPVDKRGVVDKTIIHENYQFFKVNNLKICQDEKFFQRNFATYPVIRIDFKYLESYSLRSITFDYAEFLNYVFRRYSFLSKSSKLSATEISRFCKFTRFKYIESGFLSNPDIIEAFEFLIECVYKHFDNKKILLLIDNYDYPFRRLITEETSLADELPELYELLSYIMSNTVNSKYVERALVTGVHYFDIFGSSQVNTIRKYSILDDNQFRQYFGLSELELDVFLAELEIEDERKAKFKHEYGGYVSRNGLKLFPIYPILIFLLKDKIYQHIEYEIDLQKMEMWAVMYAFGKLCNFQESFVMERLEKMEMKHFIELKNIFTHNPKFNIYYLHQPDLFLNFILDRGCFSYDKTTDADNSCKVKIINNWNEDVQQTFSICEYALLDSTRFAFKGDDARKLTQCGAIFDQLFPSFDNKTLRDFNEKFNDNFISLANPTEERYTNLIFSILCRTQFLISDEGLTFTDGKPDLIFHRENLGLIVQVTYKQSLGTALNKLIENYANVFEEQSCFTHIKDVIYLGLNINESKTLEMKFILNVD